MAAIPVVAMSVRWRLIPPPSFPWFFLFLRLLPRELLRKRSLRRRAHDQRVIVDPLWEVGVI
jgi:hypothetical protein